MASLKLVVSKMTPFVETIRVIGARLFCEIKLTLAAFAFNVPPLKYIVDEAFPPTRPQVIFVQIKMPPLRKFVPLPDEATPAEISNVPHWTSPAFRLNVAGHRAVSWKTPPFVLNIEPPLMLAMTSPPPAPPPPANELLPRIRIPPFMFK